MSIQSNVPFPTHDVDKIRELVSTLPPGMSRSEVYRTVLRRHLSRSVRSARETWSKRTHPTDDVVKGLTSELARTGAVTFHPENLYDPRSAVLYATLSLFWDDATYSAHRDTVERWVRRFPPPVYEDDDARTGATGGKSKKPRMLTAKVPWRDAARLRFLADCTGSSAADLARGLIRDHWTDVVREPDWRELSDEALDEGCRRLLAGLHQATEETMLAADFGGPLGRVVYEMMVEFLGPVTDELRRVADAVAESLPGLRVKRRGGE